MSKIQATKAGAKEMLAEMPAQRKSSRAARKVDGFIVIIIWLFARALSPAHGNLFQLNNMITEATGKPAWLYYNFYGCHCGLGGEGQPKDDSDRCCQLHDTCYLNLLNHGCNAYKQSYRYSWHHGILSCGKGSWCAQLSCECDRSLALCLKRNVGSYNKLYQFYPNLWCK